MNEKQLRKAIEQLLDGQPDNQRLRDNLEGLCRDPLFAGLTWSWGPRLYARGRAVFRPFILNHFSEWTRDDKRWTRVRWDDHAADLDAWLQAARTARDAWSGIGLSGDPKTARRLSPPNLLTMPPSASTSISIRSK